MYVRKLNLKDNEIAAKVNAETGEITTLKTVLSSLPDNHEVWLPNSSFHKTYEATWNFLIKELKSDELKVVTIMSLMASANTNSLSPLNEELPITSLADYFKLDRSKIKKILNRLFDIGVFAKFEVSKTDVPYTKYWILNPYVSFKGKLVNSDIARLFHGTLIHNEFVKFQNQKRSVYYN